MRTGGKIIIDQLISWGISQVFCVPGESYLEILNALYDVPHKIKVCNARHEAGAANMAEAYGKLTGKPGIALVTRGPGACHASIGVHIAYQDSTPMILIIGQVAQNTRDREAFQEINFQSMFGSISKWTAQIDQVHRIPEYMTKAYNLSITGRPGPVVLSIPENILSEGIEVSDTYRVPHFEAAPEKSTKLALEELFAKSICPMILVGGSSWCEEAKKNILFFTQKHSIPVVSGFRRQDIVDNNSPVFCGSLGTSVSDELLKRVDQVDLLLVIGSRLGEITTKGYEILKLESSEKKLIHVHVDPGELGALFVPDLAIVSSPKNFCDTLLNLDLTRSGIWNEWCKKLNSEYLFDLEPPECSGLLDLGIIFNDLDQSLPYDAVITLDAGNHTGWPQRFLKYSASRRQIGSTCGAMGYSIPAAVAIAMASPDKKVIAFVGDGGFMMSGLELMTAVQYKVPLIVVVFNNNSYGTIRMHQEKVHPGRVIATNLPNPDFRAMAISMGAHGEFVEKTDEFVPAFERCLKQRKPSLIELKTDINQINTRSSLKKN